MDFYLETYLTYIVIAWDEFKAVLHPEIFGGIRVVISTVC